MVKIKSFDSSLKDPTAVVPDNDEPVWDTNTKYLKIGDGTTNFDDLDGIGGDGGQSFFEIIEDENAITPTTGSGTPNIIPRADGEGGIGTNLKSWLNGFFHKVYFTETTTPSTPTSGKLVLYSKNDKLYTLNDSGTETEVGSGTIPSQTGNTGKYLQTDGTSLLWNTPSGGGGSSYYVVNRGIEGTIYTTTFLYWVTPKAGIVTDFVCSLAVCPSGSSVIVDLRKNGNDPTNTILTTPSEIETTHSANISNGLYIKVGSIDSEKESISEGDALYITITQVGSVVAGIDMNASVVIQFV